MEFEFKGTKDWYRIESGVFSKEVEQRLLDPKYKGVKNLNGEIAQCWVDCFDETLTSTEESIANATMMANALNMFEALKRVKQYLQDNKDVLTPFPTRSEIDNINEVLRKSIK
jgi:hypothetical protein